MVITPMMLMGLALAALAYINWTLHRDLKELAECHNSNADLIEAMALVMEKHMEGVKVDRD